MLAAVPFEKLYLFLCSVKQPNPFVTFFKHYRKKHDFNLLSIQSFLFSKLNTRYCKYLGVITSNGSLLFPELRLHRSSSLMSASPFCVMLERIWQHFQEAMFDDYRNPGRLGSESEGTSILFSCGRKNHFTSELC